MRPPLWGGACVSNDLYAFAGDAVVPHQLGLADRLVLQQLQDGVGANAGGRLHIEADGGQGRGHQLAGLVTAETGHGDVLRDAQPQLPGGLVDAVGDAVGGAQQHLGPVGAREDLPRPGIGGLEGEVRLPGAHAGDAAPGQPFQDALLAPLAHRFVLLGDPEAARLLVPAARHVEAQRLPRGKVVVDHRDAALKHLPEKDHRGIHPGHLFPVSLRDVAGHHDDAVHPHPLQVFQAANLKVQIALGVDKQRGVILGAQVFVHRRQDAGRGGGIKARQDHADQVGTLGAEPGEWVRFEMIVGDCLFDAVIVALPDAFAVQIAGDGALGHPCPFCHIVDGRPVIGHNAYPLMLYFLYENV